MATTGISITLDKPRVLKLTFPELQALETRLQKPVGDIFGDLSKLSFHAIHHLMFAALRHEDKKLRFESVATMIQEYLEDGHDIGDLLQVINEAIQNSGVFGRGAGSQEPASQTAKGS